MLKVFSNRDDSDSIPPPEGGIATHRQQTPLYFLQTSTKVLLTPVPEVIALFYSLPAIPTWGYGTHRRVARFPPCKHPLESPPYHLLARSPYTGDRALFASTAPKNNGQTASGLCKAIQGRNLLGACWIPKDAGAWVITKRGSLKRAIHPVTTRVC